MEFLVGGVSEPDIIGYFYEEVLHVGYHLTCQNPQGQLDQFWAQDRSNTFMASPYAIQHSSISTGRAQFALRRSKLSKLPA